MSALTDFYCHSGKIRLKNNEELTLDEILNRDNEFWQECHDFIQYLLPCRTPSKMCETAPILTQEDAEYIYTNAKDTFHQVIDRFGYFLDSVDMNLFNHNHLRITRMLESIALICSNAEALITLGCVMQIENLYFDNEVALYWVKAVGKVWSSLCQQ